MSLVIVESVAFLRGRKFRKFDRNAPITASQLRIVVKELDISLRDDLDECPRRPMAQRWLAAIE